MGTAEEGVVNDTPETAEERKQRGAPRKMILRVSIDCVIPREDGTKNVDVITSENLLKISDDTKPSKIMAALKPQIIDTLQKGREHVPTKIIVPKKSAIIMPE